MTEISTTSGNDQLNHEQEVDIGNRIRDLRIDRGLTIKELAALSELSVNALSLIENGKTSPSINTMRQIGKALKVPMTKFFEPQREEKKVVYIPKNQRNSVFAKVAEFSYLSKDLVGKGFDVLIVSTPPLSDSGPIPINHSGYEFVFCLIGKILYSVENEHFLLEPGDSVAFIASLNHQWKNLDTTESKYLLVMVSTETEPALIAINEHFPDKH